VVLLLLKCEIVSCDVVGTEPTDVCVDFVTPPSSQLTDRPRRQTGTATTVTQYAVGNDLPGRDTRGKSSPLNDCLTVTATAIYTDILVLPLTSLLVLASCMLGSIVEQVHLVSWLSVVKGD